MQDDSLSKALQVDVLAAALKSDHQQNSRLIEWLGEKFETILPQQTTVVRDGWFLSSKKPIKELTVKFDEIHFVLQCSKQGNLTAKQLKVVRDVALKTTEVPLERWIEDLAQSLSKLSAMNSEARQALDDFLLGK